MQLTTPLNIPITVQIDKSIIAKVPRMSHLKDFTPRIYQEAIFNTCTQHNTLVVLPTGIGKTAIFLMMASYRLNLYPNSKVLLLGPTRPLIDQYYSVFEKHFDIAKDKIVIFTGFVTPEKRAQLWGESQIIFSTPQGLENDILSGRIDISNVSLIGFDESHRAVGDYSYTFVAKQYMKKALHPRIVALTASPGSDDESITEVCQNLFIEKIEVRTTDDGDVSPYVQDVDIKKVYVELPDELIDIKNAFEECYNSKIAELKKLGVHTDSLRYSKKNLLGLQASIHSKIAQGDRDYETLRTLSILAELMKLQHAIELASTQGVGPLKEYLDKLHLEARTGRVKATQNLVADMNFRRACFKTEAILGKFEHPKIIELKNILGVELDTTDPENSKKKIIIFSQYRDAGSKIVSELVKEDFSARLFVGQAKKKDTGLSQKKQKAMLDAFSNNEFNILVSSSVGEEGLDIPQVDMVIFYEPVPSAIRKIQRSGRTGRLSDGRIIMLVTKDTSDEVYYHVARSKEKRMYRSIDDMKKNFSLRKMIAEHESPAAASVSSENKMCTLNDYSSSNNVSSDLPAHATIHQTVPASQIRIVADYREKGSNVLKDFVNKDIDLKLEKLDIGDFLLSSDVVVEYKTVQDFVDSIIDGRLLSQLKNLKKYSRPIIIIEGVEDMFSVRRIHPNAIRGMLATIAVSYGIPLIQTKNFRETVDLMIIIAKKEQQESKNDIVYHHGKPLTLKEQQEFFISALPSIGLAGARPLLNHFKTVRAIVNASEKELQDVDLIGLKKSKTLSEIFEKEWEE
jgi:Fanconi anemia group M protein